MKDMAEVGSAFDMSRQGDGSFQIDLHPLFTNGIAPHGGYLVGVLGRAAANALGPEVDHPYPLATSVQFVAAAEIGPARIVVEPLRSGRSASQFRVTLEQDGTPRVAALVTMGRLAGAEPDLASGRPPSLPPEEECIPLPIKDSSKPVPIWEVVDMRLDPACAGWTRREPQGLDESRGLLRMPAVTPPWLHLALDTLPAIPLELRSRGWLPTLELTAYMRAVPAPGPLRLRQSSNLIRDGFFDQHCEIWDSDGQLVAHSTQFAGVRFG